MPATASTVVAVSTARAKACGITGVSVTEKSESELREVTEAGSRSESQLHCSLSTVHFSLPFTTVSKTGKNTTHFGRIKPYLPPFKPDLVAFREVTDNPSLTNGTL